MARRALDDGQLGARPHALTRRAVVGGAAGAAAAMGAWALAGCGAPNQPAARMAASEGKVVFWQESTSEPARQLWAAMAASFKEAHPKVELQIDATPLAQGQSRDDKLFATLGSGSAWDTWQRDIPPSYQQPLVEFIPIFYNKTAWAKAGIKEAPRTWDQFLALNRTLTASGAQPMNIARGRTNPGHNFSIYLMGLIGKDGFEDLLYRDKKWDQYDGVVRAAQTLVDFQRQGWIPQDSQTGAYDVGADFQNAKQAMWGNGTWAVSDFERRKRETPGFDYDFFIPPSQDAKIRPTITGGLGGGFSVWSETKNAQATVTFLDFLMSPTAQKHWIEILFQVAPVPFKPEDYKVPEGMTGALRTIASGQEMGYNVSVVVPAKFVDVYWDGLVDILNTKVTPKEWTTKLQQEWDVAKRENRTPRP
jgi:ABC-type glycerol-3-phosphate transport system substrate-binding protein